MVSNATVKELMNYDKRRQFARKGTGKKMKKECKPRKTPQKLELEASASLFLIGKGARLNQ